MKVLSICVAAILLFDVVQVKGFSNFLIKEDPGPVNVSVRLIFVSESGTHDEALKDVGKHVDKAYFDKTKPTIFYIHGFTENFESWTVQLIIKVLLKLKWYNIIIVNWGKVSKGRYEEATKNALLTAKELARVLEELYKKTKVLSGDNIIFIGHSLGAQIAGTASREMKKGIAPTIIICVDPAGPGFEFSLSDPHGIIPIHITNLNKAVNKNDTVLVICINTDAKKYGSAKPICDININPNGGHRPQPSCPKKNRPGHMLRDDFCHHQMSVKLVAQMLKYMESKKTGLLHFYRCKIDSCLKKDLMGEEMQNCVSKNNPVSDVKKTDWVTFSMNMTQKEKGTYCGEIILEPNGLFVNRYFPEV